MSLGGDFCLGIPLGADSKRTAPGGFLPTVTGVAVKQVQTKSRRSATVAKGSISRVSYILAGFASMLFEDLVVSLGIFDLRSFALGCRGEEQKKNK